MSESSSDPFGAHDESRGVFRSNEFSVMSDELRFQGNVVGLSTRIIKDSKDRQYSRDVVFHPGAVAVVALTDLEEVWLVRQYRAPVDGCIWEIPAGKRDVLGEEPALTAARELGEEAGVAAGTLEPLIGVYQSAGFSDEFCHVFLATDLTSVPQQLEGPEEETMELAKFKLDDCLNMISSGQITDAKTVAGLFAAAAKRNA